MGKNENMEIDKLLTGSPVYMIDLIKISLDTKSVNKKLSARNTLVKMGKKVLPEMNKLLKSGDLLTRMEAVKIIELIGNRISIPVMINLLDDIEFDIRWIAAEALIKIGRRSITPVLKSVGNRENSILFNEGVHHILMSLLTDSEKKTNMKLLLSLDNHHSLGAAALMEASNVLGPGAVEKVKMH